MENTTLEQPVLEPDTNNESDTQDNGSNLGRFKDAKTLLEAYNSLHAEFTRKSQKLAELQKENDAHIDSTKSEISLDDFLKDKTDSDKYKKEITEILANNEDICNLPNKYHVALKIIQESERKTADHLNNPVFIDKYLNENTSLKNNIISEYLSKLNNISTAPKIISGNASTIHFSPSVEKPKTLKDAGEIFSKMLK